MSLSPGTRLGPYEILAPLGAGGMGEVYRARDTRLGRDVAIKSLPVEFAQDPERLARFEREAKVLASVSHPNVAGIFGIEEAAHTRYLVLEFVDGETLAARLSRGALPVDDALEIALQIASAVEAAHEAGVVHRDLKPGNVMLTPGGQVKVLDFGLARLGGSERATSDPNLTSSPTRTYHGTQAGVVLGTAAYMSPEQARGKSVDRRTDIWSFGCVVFESLTGTPLFEGETVSDLIAKILQTEPDWSRLPADTPARARALVTRCLRRDPKERLRDIGDARIEFSEILAGGGDALAASAPAVRASSGVWRWVAVAAAVVAVASVAMLLTKKPVPAPLARLDLMSPDPAIAIDFMGNYAISPDGRSVAFIMADQVGGPLYQAGGPARIVVRDLERPGVRPLAGTEGAAWPFWSPDSKHIAFFADGKLRRIPAAGGGVQTLCDVRAPRGGSWGDGEIVFAPAAVSPLFRVADTGGQPVAATVLDSTRAENSHRFPTFLPDGRRFIFNAMSTGEGRELAIRIGSLDVPGARLLPVPGVCVTFAPPDYVLFVRDQTVMAQRVDPKSLELKGKAVVLDSDCSTSARVTGTPVGSASRSGVLVVGNGYQRPSQVAWHYADGRVEPVAKLEQRLLFPAISPDGRRVAVTETGRNKFSTWLVDLADGSATRVGQIDRGLRTPVWDPDGTRLVGSTETTELHVYDLTRGTDSLIVESIPVWSVTTDWSRAANVILFSPLVEGRALDCRYITLAGKREMHDYVATEANEGAAELSPDGKWIAYWSDASGTVDLIVDSFPTPSGSRRVPGVSMPTTGTTLWVGEIWWGEDGRTLVYRAPSTDNVKVVDVRTQPALELGAPRTLMQLPGDRYGDTWDAHNRRMLVITPVGTPRSSLIVIQNWQRQLEKAN